LLLPVAPVVPVVPVVLLPTLLPPVAPGVVLFSVPDVPEPLSTLLPPVAPGVVLFSVPAPDVLLPLSSELPPVAPGVVFPKAPLPVMPSVDRFTVHLPEAPLPVQVTPDVVVSGWPGTFWAKTAPGMLSAATESARMVTFIVCSCCNGCP
jgi:hypothetical protein